MQSNNVKHRERTISSVLFNARTLILTLVITMTMVMGTAFFANTAQAVSGSGATVRVATFDQLNDALGNGGVSDIIIDPQAAEEFADNEDAEISFDGSDVFYIPIEYPLVVSHDVTISSEVAVNFARSGNGGSGKYDSKTFRGQNEVTPALFNVDQGKTLELSGDIAMTGEEVSATFDSAEGSFLFTVKARDNLGEDEDGNEAWSYGSDPGKLSKGGYFIYTKGGNVVMNDGILLMGLNTQDNVKDIAPVYIDGTAKAATLTVDGAEIVDNNLGQTEDGNSTAGAVILKGSNATAALNSGEISNNNADVAGIIVKEEAELELGSDFGINDSDIYDEKAEEAAKEEAAEEKAAEEETKEEAVEEAPIVAPKKSLKSFKAPATQMRSTGNVVNGTITVSTSAQLKAALTNNEVNTIILDKGSATVETTTSNPNGTFYLTVDEPLTVSRAVTIKTKDSNTEVIIARSEKFKNKVTTSNPAIFNVSGSGQLTLSSKITMTGDEVKNETEAVNLQLVSDSGKYYGVVGGDAGKLKTFSIVSSSNDRVPMYIDSNGYILINYVDESTGAIKTGGVRWLNLLREAYPGNTDYRLVELDQNGRPGAFASSLSSEKTYVISVGSNKFLRDDIGGATDPNVVSNALKLKAVPDGSTSGSGAGLKYKFTVDHKDGTSGNTAVWTKGEVKEGGYFIHSTNGGKVTINQDVTLKNIKTATTVTKAAPIYIGSGSEFTMNGGFIQGNTIGYAAADPAVEAKSDKAVVQYSGDPNGGVRQFVRGIDMTNTAGGIIFDGNNTKGFIKGGSIKNNQADVGGILVKDGATVTFGTDKDTSITNPSIDNNIGFHHAGAVQVESGGTVTMYSGKLSNNVAWHRGGAVWATEFGTTGYVNNKSNPTNKHAGGNFIMKGGSINNNFAFVRGGGINVESNGVSLEGGTISENKCKSLGGGIYVEGDTAAYSYTLVIKKGDIRGNTAVRGANDDLDQKLKGNVLTDGTTYGGYGGGHHNDDDFPNGHAGNGGGIWLCPLGGTSVFATNRTTGAKVVIDGNFADDNGSGDDFFLTRGKGSALIQNLEGTWKYDNGNPVGNVDSTGKVLTGPVGMYADGSVDQNTGIKIHNNISRDGGGIAANGTVILGETEHVYRFDAELELEKEWDQALLNAKKDEPVTLELKYTNPYNNDELVTLSRTVATESNGTEVKDYTITIDNTEASGGEEGDVIFRNGKWKAKALISPIIYHDNDPSKPVELYRILKGDGSNENNYYDLKTTAGVEELYRAINGNSDGTKNFKVKWMNLVVSETASGINRTYNVEKIKTPEAIVKGVTKPGSGDIQIHYSTITVGQTLKNSLRDTSFTITKAKLGAPNTKLEGAEFKLYKAELGRDIFVKGSRTSQDSAEEQAARAPYRTLTSDANGVITFSNVEPGPYLLFETKVAPGYELPKSPWFIFVDEVGNPTVVRMNDNKQGQVKNNTNNPYDPSDLNTWVENKWWDKAWFKVTNNSDTLNNNPDTNVEISAEVDGDGIILIKDGEAVNESGALSNKLFELYKYNEDKAEPLGNTKFIMHGATVNSSTKIVKGGKVGGDNNNSFFVTSNESDGKIDISSLIKQALTTNEDRGKDPGNHIEALSGKRVLLLYEDQAKSGYVKAKMPWLVVLDMNTNEILEVREYKDKYSNDTEWDYADFNKVIWAYNGSSNLRTSSTGDKILENDKLSFELTKVSSSNTNLSLQGATLRATEIANEDKASKFADLSAKWFGSTQTSVEHHLLPGTTVGTETSGADGKVRFNFNEAGVYLIFEDEAPEGYKKADNPWILVIKDDGDYVLMHNNTTNAKVGNDHWNTKDYTKCDGLVLKDDLKPIELYKVDEKKDANAAKLGGAKFVLLEAEKDGNNYYKVRSTSAKDTVWSKAIKGANNQPIEYESADNTGKIVINDLAAGTYMMFETTAPKGFVRSTSPWIIIVRDDNSGRHVTVKKVKDDFKNKVDVGGNVVETVAPETAANAQIVHNRWWLAGSDDATGWFTTMTEPYNLSNAPKYLTKVDINHVNDTNPGGLSGGVFELYTVKSGTGFDTGLTFYRPLDKLDTITSDLQGRIQLPSSMTANKGLYMLFETTPPSGYKRAYKPWLLEVKENRDIEVSCMEEKITSDSTSDGSQTIQGVKWWASNKFSTKTWSDKYRIPNTPNQVVGYKKDGYTKVGLGGVRFKVYKATHVSTTWDGKKRFKVEQTETNFVDYTSFSDPDNDGKFILPWPLNYFTNSNWESESYYYALVEDPESVPAGYAPKEHPVLFSVWYNRTDGYYMTSWDLTPVSGSTNIYDTSKNVESHPESEYCDDVIENYPTVSLTKIDLESAIPSEQDGQLQLSLKDHIDTLQGVQFKLYKATVSGNTWNKDGGALTVNGNQVITSAEGGLVDLGRLDGGNYLLEETTPKDQTYAKPGAMWRITIGSSAPNKGKITYVGVPTNDTGSSYVSLTPIEGKYYITNSKLYNLPNSGGMGTYWFMIIGAMMMGFALTAGFTKLDLLSLFRR